MYDVRLDDDVPACGMNWPVDLVDISTYLHVSHFIAKQTLLGC